METVPRDDADGNGEGAADHDGGMDPNLRNAGGRVKLCSLHYARMESSERFDADGNGASRVAGHPSDG